MGGELPDTCYDARNGDSISFVEDQVMLRLSGVVRVQLIGNDGHLPVGESRASIPGIGCTRTTAVASWGVSPLNCWLT
jgi:hypothetical protein